MDYYIYKNYDWAQTISAFVDGAGTTWTAQANLWNGDSLVTAIPASVLTGGNISLEFDIAAIDSLPLGTYRLFLSVRDPAGVERGSLERRTIVAIFPGEGDPDPGPVPELIPGWIDTAIDAAIASHAETNDHPLATTSAKGMMSSGDKTKLDGISPGATTNSTDAQLRDRATHTGTQAASTISDFSEAVDDRVGTLLVAGSNVSIAYNDAGNALTIAAESGGVSDHSELTGLSADDHTQYFNAARGDARYYRMGQPVSDSDIPGAIARDSEVASSISSHAATNDHPIATTSAKGMLSSGDKTKLDGISPGATTNSTDTQLRDRATHTGTQTASTISDFPGAVDGRLTGISASLSTKAETSDARFTDQRVPTDGSVTDAKIGDRTVNPSLATPANTGTLTALLSWITGRIKSIAGTTNWFDAPAISLATTAAHVADTSNPHLVTRSQLGVDSSTITAVTFTVNTTYTLQTNWTAIARMVLHGGGGGGCGGGMQPAGTVASGGGAGSPGGSLDFASLSRASLEALYGISITQLRIAIGAGGTAGLGATSNATIGSGGGNGGSTTIEVGNGTTWLFVGCVGGGNFSNSTTAGAAISASMFTTVAGGNGSGSAGGSLGNIAGHCGGSGSGGSGKSATIGAATSNGGTGGRVFRGLNTTLTAGGAIGSNGANGAVGAGLGGGDGGGGGGSSHAGAGGNGGNGGFPGGSGAGGGAGATSGGNGGNGAAGVAYVFIRTQ